MFSVKFNKERKKGFSELNKTLKQPSNLKVSFGISPVGFPRASAGPYSPTEEKQRD